MTKEVLPFDRHFQVDVDRSLFFGQRATQLRQRNVLQLANTLARHPKFLPNFFERLGLAAIEAEARENNFAFAIVEHFEQTAYFVRRILSRNNSNGVIASSSPTISPNSVESSSLIGASNDAGRIETVFNCETLPAAIPISSPSSSSVGSRPNSSLICKETRRILEILSTRCTGRRMVFD